LPPDSDVCLTNRRLTICSKDIKFDNRFGSKFVKATSIRCRFHQHFVSNFFIWKCFAQLLCSLVCFCNFLFKKYWQKSCSMKVFFASFLIYSLYLYIFGEKNLAKKLLVKCGWNWHCSTRNSSISWQGIRWLLTVFSIYFSKNILCFISWDRS